MQFYPEAKTGRMGNAVSWDHKKLIPHLPISANIPSNELDMHTLSFVDTGAEFFFFFFTWP